MEIFSKKHFLFVGLFFITQLLFSNEIGIISNRTIPVYDKIVKNFQKSIEAKNHSTIEIPYDDQEDVLKQRIISSGCSHFFTVGASASQACNDAGFPGVFTMVVDPLKSGLVDKSGVPINKMTGILVNVGPATQFRILQDLFIDKQRAGVIYDPNISGYLVSEYVRKSSDFGFQIYELPVMAKEEVPPAVESLKRKVDFLMGVVDNTVYNIQSIQVILRFSLTNKIPLIGFSPQQVKAGALVAFYCDYPKLGNQGAELMEKVISTTNYSSLKMELPEDTEYAINTQTAKIMKVDIPAAFENGAAEIFGQ